MWLNMIANYNNMNKECAKVEHNSKFHPCQYCEKSCIGMQCKDCHLKMVKDRNDDCIDCGTSFYAIKKDGTKRKRCFDCQNKFNNKYYKNCQDCSKSFRFVLDNGKVFDKCGSCYILDKKKGEDKKRNEDDREMNDCRKCKKEKTYYDLCRNCFRENKEITNIYMISKCIDCGQRGKGLFKYCCDCK